MGLITTLREVQDNTSAEELNRYSPDRPVMVDGSLSELVTKALDIAYTKKNPTSGEPYHGQANPTGNPAPGAGFIANIQKPDSPKEANVRPSLEGMQQMQQAEAEQMAAALVDVIDAKADDATSHLKDNPVIVYAIPQDKMVTEEMNQDIGMYGDSGAIDIKDFVFVFTDSNDTVGDNDNRVYNLEQKLTDYEGRGARVYQDLQSFVADLPNIRRK